WSERDDLAPEVARPARDEDPHAPTLASTGPAAPLRAAGPALTPRLARRARGHLDEAPRRHAGEQVVARLSRPHEDHERPAPREREPLRGLHDHRHPAVLTCRLLGHVEDPTVRHADGEDEGVADD